MLRRKPGGAWVERAPVGPAARGSLRAAAEIAADTLQGIASHALKVGTRPGGILAVDKTAVDLVKGAYGLYKFTRQSADDLAISASDIDIAEASGDPASVHSARERFGKDLVRTTVGAVAIVATGLTLLRLARPTAKGPKAAEGGGKPPNLFDVLGKERGTLTKQVLKGREPLEALTAAERQTAAQWYRGVAERTVGKNAEPARLYNIARAEYLEGTRPSIEATIVEFMKNNGL